MRVVELFAGVGGFRIGFEGPPDNPDRTGLHVVWANQWEPSTNVQHAADVYVQRWSLQDKGGGIYSNGEDDVFTNLDISDVDAASIPDHDLICGGFPCQDYSVAKTLPTAHGIAGKKGVLWWEIHRIIKAKRPKYALLENVDRLLKSPRVQRGRDFAVMLASLSDLGYSVEWRVVDSSEYGFPQRRKRAFILAVRDAEWEDPQAILSSDGILARALPIEPLSNTESFCIGKGELSEITDDFNSSLGDTPTPFGTCGIMIARNVWTGKSKPQYDGLSKKLGELPLQAPSEIPDSYILEPESLTREKGWIYLKGAKRELRKSPSGYEYNYSEGPVTFPDSLDKPSRTIVTGEGGKSPSRFKHVITFEPTQAQRESLGLDGIESERVRETMNLNSNQWLRRLTPVELERLNGFPDDHTAGVPDGRRSFFMGNALVTGVVSKIAEIIERDCPPVRSSI